MWPSKSWSLPMNGWKWNDYRHPGRARHGKTALYYSIAAIQVRFLMSAAELITPHAAGLVSDQAEVAHRCLYYMSLMREVEDRIERKLYRQGKILGGVYVGRGQEAISVGVGLLAEPEDALFPSHRDLALFLIRGVQPRQIFAQYMGRKGGLTRGRDG